MEMRQYFLVINDGDDEIETEQVVTVLTEARNYALVDGRFAAQIAERQPDILMLGNPERDDRINYAALSGKVYNSRLAKPGAGVITPPVRAFRLHNGRMIDAPHLDWRLGYKPFSFN